MKKEKWLMPIAALFLVIAVFGFGSKKVEAAGNYYAQVNKGTNVVTIFNANGTPCQAFTCSAGEATPVGTFYTSNKYTWHVLDGNVYGQYCTRITGGILFHSVWYYAQDKSTQSYAQYNKLGTLASHGCVRLTVAASKWIYDNCPSGMRVTIIQGSPANDPLGKPATIKVNANQKMGWDPTDPDPANPYARSFPTIDVSGVPRTIEYGSGFYAYNGMKARDSLGNDITGSVKVTGGVNDRQLGTYTVNYFVSDSLGRTATASVNIQVVDSKPASISGVPTEQKKKEYNSYFNPRKGVKASNAPGADLTAQITVKVVYPKKKKEHVVPAGNMQLKKVGTYHFYYYVTNPNNGIQTKAQCSVKVQDTKKPIITGVKQGLKTLEYNKTVNLRSGVKAKLVSGKSLTSKIKVAVKEPGSKKWKTLSTEKGKKYTFKKLGTFTVRYTSVNPTSKKAATKVRKFKIQDTKAPVITGVVTEQKTFEYGKKVNLLKSVRAKLVSGKSLTDKIQVDVIRPNVKGYVKLSQKQSKEFCFDKVGSYIIRYSSTNPTSKKTAIKKRTIVVVDTKAPQLQGDWNEQTIEQGTALQLMDGVTAQLVSKTDVTEQIRISVQFEKEAEQIVDQASAYTFDRVGDYTITYTVKNPNSDAVAKATKKIHVTGQGTQSPDQTNDQM